MKSKQWIKITNTQDNLEQEMVFLGSALIDSIILGLTLLFLFLLFFFSSEVGSNFRNAFSPVLDGASYVLFLCGCLSSMIGAIVRRVSCLFFGTTPWLYERWLNYSNKIENIHEKKFAMSFLIISMCLFFSFPINLLFSTLPTYVGYTIPPHINLLLVVQILLSFSCFIIALPWIISNKQLTKK